jgi:hypothetical protein
MSKRLLIACVVVIALGFAIGSTVLAGAAAQEDSVTPPMPPVGEEDTTIVADVAPGNELLGDVGAAWKTDVAHPGIYIFYDYRNYNPADFPGVFVGGHYPFQWQEIETSYHVYNWGPVDNWIANQAAYGKPVGLAINAYEGVSGGDVSPSWLAKINCIDGYGNPVKVPAYWYASYVSELQQLITAFGARYNNDDRVAWVEISTGMYGENQPVPDQAVMEQCMYDAGLHQYQWEEYMKDVVDIYRAAFPNKPLMVQHYPVYVHDMERKTIGNYAGPLGVGFKGDGLIPDRDKAVNSGSSANHIGSGLDANILVYSTTTPIGFETYGFYLSDSILQYWAMLNALDKRADYIAVGEDMFTDGDPERLSSLRLANRYLGKNVNTTPDIWVAMRESGFTFYPQYGNYDFFLEQDDNVSGGKTRAVTYRAAGSGAWQIQNTALVDPWVGFLSGKEGWITRRTDQATENPYMWFKADDGYIYGGTNAISITVTYLDRGTDTWSLEYDGPGGAYTLADTITKSNTGAWQKHTFYIDDARMSNGLLGLSDFRIDCNGDGDEYIHMVALAKRSGQPTHDVSLQAGANLVSIPLTTASTALEDVLTSVSGNYTKVFAFDGSAKSWKSYDVSLPGWANSLQTIDRTMGFWIYMNSASTLSVSGDIPTSTSIPLYTGANLIGFPRSNAQSVADALASIAGKYTKVFEYDAATSSWKSYDVSLPGWANSLQQMRPGYGYWVYVTENCTLTVSN